MANGGAQIGFVSKTSDVLIGISQGVPYKCFGATFQASPGCLMVLAKSDIFSVKDLEGKGIGMQDDARQQVLGILQSNGVQATRSTWSSATTRRRWCSARSTRTRRTRSTSRSR